jgi:hypothetical protein
VTRSTADAQKGYSWLIEFVSDKNQGNLPALIADSSGLVVSSVGAEVWMSTTSFDGNEVLDILVKFSERI